MANETSKVVHFDCLKRATIKPRVHKLSESELEPSSSSSEEVELSDYTPNYRQPAKPVNAKIDAAKPQAPLEKQNAHAITPRKAKPANDATEAKATPKVDAATVTKQATLKDEATPVAKQATPAMQEGPDFGSPLALAPPDAPKVDKAKRVKYKPPAPPLAPTLPTRTS